MSWIACGWAWITNHATVLAAVVSAIAAGVIAWFTINLARATTGMLAAASEQARLALESINFARLEFNATHRPKLVIREAHILRPTGQSPCPGVSFAVANAGDTHADIVESHVRLEFNESVVLLPLRSAEHENAVGPLRIAPGESVVAEHGSNIDGGKFINEENRQMYATEETYTKLWFRGFVIYLDNNRVRRRMAFCRGYDFKARRFRAGDDPEYEYSD